MEEEISKLKESQQRLEEMIKDIANSIQTRDDEKESQNQIQPAGNCYIAFSTIPLKYYQYEGFSLSWKALYRGSLQN